MYNRKIYDTQLSKLKGLPLVKVLTGIRRVGKSTILRMFRDRLLQDGTPPDDILYLDMERMEFANILDAAALHQLAASRLAHNGRPRFLFIDEVQQIAGWERAINSLLNEGGIDIYLTGSNASLLSSELASLLTGRYVEIPVYPLSFAEYATFRGVPADTALFQEFLIRGGMPGLHMMTNDEEVIRQYLGSLIDSVVLKDVVGRYSVRDVDLLQRLTAFLADNSGNVFSAKRIADFMKNERRSVGVETVYNYISYLISAFLIHRLPRFDLKGKRFLEVSEKYYFADMGLKNALIGYRHSDINAALELVVFLELKRRGYTVSVGRLGDAEIDFIAERSGERMYIQVCYLLADETVSAREFGPLEALRDNYPKFVLSMDQIGGRDHNGIQRLYLPDFLLADAIPA